MSTTIIYRLGRDPGEIGETRNSWRGAMYVWNDIAKRYFGLSGFGFDESVHVKIWNAENYVNLPFHENLVLKSTMDNAVVRGEDIEAVISAFEKYGQEHPNSSISEQTQILRAAEIRPGDYIAWNQTSVNGDFWAAEWDEEIEDMKWYDPSSGDLHFDVFESANETNKRVSK